MKRKMMLVVAMIILFLGVAAPSVAASNAPKLTINYKKTTAALVYDATTKQLLASQNLNKPLPVASVAKLMTLYLVLQKLHNHPAWWDAKVDTSYAGLKKMSKNYDVGGFVFKRNSYTVKQLFQAALVMSSNNATIALGQWVAGGHTPKANRKFIKMMNQAAQTLKMKSASFVSASGLEQTDLKQFGYAIGGNNANQMSANDILIVVNAILQLDSGILQWSSQSSMKVAGQWLENSNRMLANGEQASSDLPTYGLKTGYTKIAQNCLVTVVKRKNDHMLITVTLHSQGRVFEYGDTKSLLRKAYRFIPQLTAYKQQQAQLKQQQAAALAAQRDAAQKAVMALVSGASVFSQPTPAVNQRLQLTLK